jgi:hypothetical protein
MPRMWSLLLLGFANGIMITLIILFFLEGYYEDELLDRIIHESTTHQMNEEQRVIKLMKTTHDMLKARQLPILDAALIAIPKTRFITSLTNILITPDGACGVYSIFLARLLQRSGLDVRIPQLLCEPETDDSACHVVTEVRINNQWHVMDPLFGIYFRRPSGTIDDVKGIAENWSYYSRMMPSSYDQRFSYQNVRYSNWRGYGFIKSFLELFLGANSLKKFSIRAYILNMYTTVFILLAITYIPLLLGSLLVISKNSRGQAK